MTLEQRYVLCLLNNKPFNPNLFSNLNFDTVIDILLEHKIFLHYYPLLNQHIIDPKTKTRANQIYLSNVLYKKVYFEIFKKLVNFLDEHKIDY